MDFGAKAPIEVIRKGAFGGRDIYSDVNGKWYKKSWKECDHLKNIDQISYRSNYCDVNVNKFGVKCGTLLRFLKNESWINKIDPYEWFQQNFRYWLGRISHYDKRQINRRKKLQVGLEVNQSR